MLLDENRICANPGLRSLAKLMLNSFWGKFGQRENPGQVSIINNPKDFFDKLENPNVEVHQVIPINEDMLIVHWQYLEESALPLSTVNVVIAAYTTTHARLELYEYLDTLGENVLYYDTDSVIYIQRPGDVDLPVGDYLGELTNELELYGKNAYIRAFSSSGPKSYAFEVVNPDNTNVTTVCKVKGICLNHKNSSTINFESLTNAILNNTSSLTLLNSNKIVRTKTHSVVSKPEIRVFQVVYTKRKRCASSFETLPYGFKQQKTE